MIFSPVSGHEELAAKQKNRCPHQAAVFISRGEICSVNPIHCTSNQKYSFLIQRHLASPGLADPVSEVVPDACPESIKFNLGRQ